MAKHNPFSIFRRNQRAWMAGLTLFTMFSFIALGSMLQCVGSRNQTGGVNYVGEVAKTRSFGAMKYNDYVAYRNDMARLIAFLSYLAQTAQSQSAYPSPELQNVLAQLNYASSNGEWVVDRWLIEKFAKKSKLIGNDHDAEELYKRLVQLSKYDENQQVKTGAYTKEELAGAFRSSGLSETSLFDLLKRQIGYDRMIRQYDAGILLAPPEGFRATTVAQAVFGHGSLPDAPGDVLEGYEALHRMARLKVASFNAENYVDEVGEPTDAQAKKLYEQYKNVVYSASGVTPGFTQPTKIALQVVRMEADDAAKDAISMEDVQKFYEEHKEEFRIPKREAPKASNSEQDSTIPDEILNTFGDAPAVDVAAPAETPAPEAAPAETPAPEAAPAEAPAPEAAPAETPAPEAAPAETPAPEAAPAETPAPEAAPVETPAPEAAPAEAPAPEAAPAEAPAPEAAPAEAPAPEAAPAETPAPEAAPAEAPAEQTLNSLKSAETLVAYQQDAEAPAAETPAPEAAPAAETPAPEAAPAETPAPEAAPAAETPAPEAAPAAETPAPEAAPAAETPAPEAAPAAETPAPEAAPAAETPAPEAAPVDDEYFPLEQVEGTIRQRIASERIAAKMTTLFDQLKADYRKSILSDSNADDVVDKDALKKFADENGAQYYVTTAKTNREGKLATLVSLEEASVMDVLPASDLQALYSSVPQKYQPRSVPEDLNPDASVYYVYRAVNVVAEHTPDFDEKSAKDDGNDDAEEDALTEVEYARDEVVRAWKIREAAKLAEADAKKFLEEASAEGADFDELVKTKYPKAKVVETEKFSWFRSSGMYPQLSEVRELGVEAEQADRDNVEIVAPGLDFYEAAFALTEGQVGFSWNQPKDRAFVMKAVEMTEVPAEELENVQSDIFASIVAMQLKMTKIEKFHIEMMESLREQAGFEWVSIPRVERDRR